MLRQLGQEPYYNAIPTGWDETGPEWVSSGHTLARLDVATRISFNRNRSTLTHLQLIPYYQSRGLETEQAITDFTLHLMLGADFSALEQSLARLALGEDNLPGFDFSAGNAETRLRQMVTTVLAMPGFQLQ